MEKQMIRPATGTATLTVGRHVATAVDTQVRAATRLLFVDNLRVLLTILVILHHLMITYAGNGSWYYQEGRQDVLSGALGGWFLAVNQAYFMGLFLLISAYFVPGSYDRKGARHFLQDRLIRLGIPLALYSWLIRPLLAYLNPVRHPDGRPPLVSFLTGTYFQQEALFGGGPLWFVETLLIFSAVYVAWRLLTQRRPAAPAAETPFPGSGRIVLLALLLGATAFLVRLWLPMGWSWVALNLQFPFFVQYIALFILGLIAYRRNWLVRLPERTGRRWLAVALVTTLFFGPMAMIGGIDQGTEPFMGGWHWQALAYALWESFLAVAMCIGLVYLFRRHANRQGAVAAFLSRNAYAAYLVHEVVIIAFAYAVRPAVIYPLLKWAAVSLITIPLCFLLGSLLRRLPHAGRVL
ncbi:MAG TPA: acyltransferase [Anaerolineae bacterium]|nr:acyltransferase [Anaerolineae bacterium]